MKLPDLFALIFLNSPTDNTDGGGQFLLELSDASLKADKRGRGRNPLYGPFGTKPMPADKRAKLDSDTRQRWYSGGRPLTTGRAKYWASNFDHAALNDWLYKRWHPVGRIAEIRAILHNNGYEVSDGYAAIDKVVTLLKVGLENASHGIQIIDDKRWNPSISDATDAERARPLRQRFSELTPGDVVVRGDVLIVKGQEFQFPPVTGPTVKATAVERVYAQQVLLAIGDVYTVLDVERLRGKSTVIRDVHATLRQLEDDPEATDYLDDFNLARECYYRADHLQLVLQEACVDGTEEFGKVKHDMLIGVRPTLRLHSGNAYEKMQATLEKSTQVTLQSSLVTTVVGLFENQHRQGITHMLVNDGKLRWSDDAS